jgi:16S rRNA (cytosine967-C5)-methyltransferase
MSKQNISSGLKAREVAVRTLMAVTLKNRPFDVALDDIAGEAKLNARDRAFVLNLLMLCLRRHGSLKGMLASLMTSGLPRNATWTEAALLTGLAQILLMRTADYAAVNETVTLVKNLPGKEAGFSGLVNAVLRRASREQEKLTKKLNKWPAQDLPKWLFDSWANTYGKDKATSIAKTLQSTPPLDISLKPDQDAQEWAKKLDATLLPTGTLRREVGDVTALPGYEEGHWWVQDFAAAIPARLLGDIKGKHVLDLCAAPGGKTMQLAASGADVTSVDRNKNRLKRLTSNLERTGLRADVINGDAARYVANAAPIDHILLDAPCSATGTLRRNPDVIWTKSEEDVTKLSATQARILDHAFKLLPVGGTLVYCVCSLEQSEGIDQVNSFLSRTPSAKRVGIKAEEVGGYGELITSNGDLLCLPSLMAASGGMDGFFAARITKA